MKEQRNIYMTKDAQIGACGVCGTYVTLRYQDTSCGFFVGACCLGELVAADAVLGASARLRHPTEDELDWNH